MVNKNVEVKFTSSTKSFESGINRVIGLMSSMDSNLGKMGKNTDKMSSIMDKAIGSSVGSFGKLEKGFQGVSEQSEGLKDNAGSLQGVLNKIGDMKNLGKANKGLEEFGGSIDDAGNKAGGSSKNIERMDVVTEALGISSDSVAGLVVSSYARIISSSGRMVTDVMSNLTKLTSGFDSVFTGLADKASGSLNSISGKFSQMGISSNSLTGKIKSLAGAFSVFKILDKGVSMVSSSVDTAIDRFDTLNNSDLVFKNMGFEVEEVDGMMGKLLGSIEGLPTPLQDSIKDVQLLGATTRDLDKSVDVYSALNNGILGFGGSGEQVTRTIGHLNRAMQKGHIDGTTYNSLMDTMGVAMGTVAEEMGHSTESLREGLSEGEISIDSFLDMLIKVNKEGGGSLESLEKIARDATQGIRTSMSNLRTAIGRNMTNIMMEIDKVLEDNGLPKIGEMIRNVTKEVNKLGDILVGKVSPIFDKFNELGRDTLVMFAAIPLVMPTVLGILGKMGVGFGKLGKGMSSLPKKNENMFSNMGEGLGSMLSKIPGVNSNLGEVGGILSKIGTIGDNTIGSLIRMLGSLMGTAMSVIAPTAILGTLLIGFGLVNEVYGEEIGKLLDKIRTEWPQLITGIVDGIVTRLPDLIKQGADLVGNILDAISVNLPHVLEGGMEIMRTLIKGVEDNSDLIMPAVKDIIRTLSQAIVVYLPELLDMGLKIIIGISEGINENREEILLTMKNLIKNLLDVILENAPAMLKMGSDFMGMLIDGFVLILPDIMQFGLDILPAIMGAVEENMDKLVEGAFTIMSTLAKGLTDNMPKIVEMAMTILPGLVKGIIDNIMVLVEGAFIIIMALVDALFDNLPEILDVGIAIIIVLITEVIRNIPKIIGLGLTLILALAAGIIDNLPEILKAGIRLIIELAFGIIKGIPYILLSIGIMFVQFINEIGKLLGKIGNAGFQIAWSLFTGIIKGMFKLSSKLFNGASWVWNKVAGIFGKETKEITLDTENKYSEMGDKIVGKMEGMGEGIDETFTGIEMDTIGSMGRTNEGVSEQSDNMVNNLLGDFEDIREGSGIENGEMLDNMILDYGEMSSVANLETTEIKENTIETFEETTEGVGEETGNMVTIVDTNFGAMRSSAMTKFLETREGAIRETGIMREGVGRSYEGLTGDMERETSQMEANTGVRYSGISSKAIKGSRFMREEVVKEQDNITENADTNMTRVEDITEQGYGRVGTIVTDGLEGAGEGWVNMNTEQNKALSTMKESLATFGNDTRDLMYKAMNAMAEAIESSSGKIQGSMRSITQAVVNSLSGLRNRMYIYGAYAASGFNQGLESRMSQIRATASRMANIVTMTTRRSLDIHSPSRVMEKLGSNTGEGFNKGLSGWVGAVSRTSNNLVSSIGNDIDVGRMVENYSRELRDSQHRVDGTISNHVNGVVRTVDNTSDKKITANITLQTSNGDWKTYVEDITVEQNAMLRRGNY